MNWWERYKAWSRQRYYERTIRVIDSACGALSHDLRQSDVAYRIRIQLSRLPKKAPPPVDYDQGGAVNY